MSTGALALLKGASPGVSHKNESYIFLCTVLKKKMSSLKKSFVPTETLALFLEDIDLFNKQESE